MRHAIMSTAFGLLVVGSATAVCAPPAEAIQDTCLSAGWLATTSTCVWTWPDYQQTSTSSGGHTWVVTLQPNNGGIVRDYLLCVENGEEGFLHDVYMDGVDVGDVCVPTAETPEEAIAGLVISEFRSYSWPQSEMTIQPPGGETLVNLETIVYTTNVNATTHVVRLAGRQVTVEATPVSYVWDFGEGPVQSSSSPGHAYPDHDVFHVYESVDDYEVSVDTVYGNGRYRVGAGEWKTIEGAPTVTIAGASAGLEVLEAKPQLVR